MHITKQMQREELQAFLRRYEDRAPTGFVTRVLNACEYGDEPITTVGELHKRYWMLAGVGAKSVRHLEYLFGYRT